MTLLLPEDLVATKLTAIFGFPDAYSETIIGRKVPTESIKLKVEEHNAHERSALLRHYSQAKDHVQPCAFMDKWNSHAVLI